MVCLISMKFLVSVYSHDFIQNEMTDPNAMTTRIVRETVASLFQHVMAPPNPPPSTSFGVHPMPGNFIMEDPSSSSLNLAQRTLPPWKVVANASAAATLASSFIHTNPHVPVPLLTPPSTAPLPAPAPLPQTPLPTRSIMLAGGIRIVFTENDVPRSPSVSFARDVTKDFPTLNGMWDDHSEHWAGFLFLKIQGRPIPLVYWKAVYSAKQGNGWKPGEWKIIKSNYFDWKVSILILVFLSSFSGVCIDSGHAVAQRDARGFLGRVQ